MSENVTTFEEAVNRVISSDKKPGARLLHLYQYATGALEQGELAPENSRILRNAVEKISNDVPENYKQTAENLFSGLDL